jgi:glycosyltransferase involved in cell wall biosynthesis
MRAGVYNLGFLGVRRGEESLRILHWWSRRLRFECISAQDRGIFVDQKYIDLLPAFVRNFHISHDTTLNVAYWNLSQRSLETADSGWLVDRQKLTFFHFSGFDPKKPTKLSKYTTRLDGDLPAPLQQIAMQYADQILANGYEMLSRANYAYGTFRSGTPIHPYIRRMFRERHRAWPSDPFSDYEAFLHQYAPGTASEGGVVTNFMKFIHEITPNLYSGLDLHNPKHCEDLVHWYLFHAERDILLDQRLIAPVLARVEQRRVPTHRGIKASAVSRADATVIGYLRTTSGVGEGGRQTLRALASTGMVVNGFDVDLNVTASRDDQSCASFLVAEGDGMAQIFYINADQLPQVMYHVQTRLHDAAVRVCMPSWELSEFPDAWLPAFDRIDEIWAISRFVQRSLIRRLGKPVIYMPVAVEFPMPRIATRAEFGLPGHKVLFFFSFDFASYAKRKNPHGVIAAFRLLRKRMGLGRAGLVIKSINGRHASGALLDLQVEIKDDPDIYLIDQTLSREDTYALISVTDCVVSLHRSEGLGFLIPEAMLLGKPVIATDYSATTEFVTPQTGLSVNYRLVPVQNGEYPFSEGQLWAEPDVGHAAWQMARVVASLGTEPITSMVARAREHVRRNYSRAQVGQLQARRLQRLISR